MSYNIKKDPTANRVTIGGKGIMNTPFAVVESALLKLAELEQAEDEGRLVVLPCKVGDKVWALRRYCDSTIACEGIVLKMRYTSVMRLVIIVQNVARGYWGEKIFPTREAAEAALKKMQGGQADGDDVCNCRP